MSLIFDSEKSLQAAGLLYHVARTDRINIMKLIKLLYIADRESIREKGYPITGDRYVSMKYGPVCSQIYNLVRAPNPEIAITHDEMRWSEHFERTDHDIRLIKQLDADRLSKYEERKLREAFDNFDSLEPFELSDLTHEFEEWHDPGDSSTPISLRSVFEAVGRTEQADSMEQERRYEASFRDLFKAR